MNSLEKTVTFVRGRLAGEENVCTKTIVRDATGRLIVVLNSPKSTTPHLEVTQDQRQQL